MAVINTYPVTLERGSPPGVKSLQPRVPAMEIPRLNPKQHYVLEWLAAQSCDGSAVTLAQLPPKAGLLSVAALSERGLVKVTLKFTPRGKAVFEALAEKELIADKRAAVKMRQAKIDAAK
jgi:hypothetical protein